MIKKLIWLLFAICLFVLPACGSAPVPTQAPTIALTVTSQEEDACSSANMPATVQGINDLMREFEDSAQLAANLPAQELPDVISDLQRIRRSAEDLQVPACLNTLKTHQLNHMNLMIQTLLAFVGGSEQSVVRNGFELARQEHNLYSVELARLLGITLAPMTATPPAATSTP